MDGLDLHTVCESARCPNRGHCWSQGTATFMILGDVCSRRCPYCAVASGFPTPLDGGEPERVAEAAHRLGLRHVVVTSVARDDLTDGGAGHFAATISALRQRLPQAVVEVLVPDFRGRREDLLAVLRAGPHILNHNVETVPRLYPQVRPEGQYRRSLNCLEAARELDPRVVTKSGLMVGLGEEPGEVAEVMADLHRAGCQVLTIGQYLQPTLYHLPVVEYVTPAQFAAYRRQGLDMGFGAVFAGPLVRSSYHAGDIFRLLYPGAGTPHMALSPTGQPGLLLLVAGAWQVLR